MPDRELRWLSQAATSRFRLADGTVVPIYAWYPKQAEKGRALMRQTAAPTVLLVHGLSGRGVQMGSFADPLTQLGYRVVSFDAPGHGFAGGKRLSLPEAASAVRQVADHIGPLAGVIAHSNGAAATLVAMSQGLLAAKAVLISPPENLSRYLLRLATFLGFTPDVATLAQSRLEVRHGVSFEDLRGGLLARDLQGEALIFHDRRDRMVPFEDGETLARAWTGARLVPVNRLGHSRILRDPCVINSTARFFGEVSK